MFYKTLLISFLFTVCQPQFDGYLSACLNSGISKKTCLIQLFNDIRPLLKDGVKVLGVPSYDPLVLPNLNITHKSREVQFTGHLHNLSFHNFINFELIDLYSDDTTVKEELRFSDVLVTAHYSINGTFLNRPLRGQGLGVLTSPFLHVYNTMSYKTYMKRKFKRCEVLGINITLTLGKVYIYADGLAEESVTNKFLNAHSKLITKQLTHPLAKIFETYGKKRYDDACKENPSLLTEVIFL